MALKFCLKKEKKYFGDGSKKKKKLNDLGMIKGFPRGFSFLNNSQI